MHMQCCAAGAEDGGDEQSWAGRSMSTVAAVLADVASCAVPEVTAVAIRHVTQVLLKR